MEPMRKSPQTGWNISIRAKLALLISLLIGAISLFIYFYFPSRVEEQALGAIAEKAHSIAEMTAFSISPALFFEDVENIERVFNSAKQNRDLVYVVVLDQTRRVVAAYNEDIAVRAQYQELLSGNPISRDRSIYRVASPILHNGQQIGSLSLGLSLQNLRSEISQSRAAIALVSLFIFLAGITTVFAISTLVTGPLSQIVETVNRVARGHFAERAKVGSRDEVGHLAESFNLMIESLETAYTELKDQSQDLSKLAKELQEEINERKRAEDQIRNQAALLDITKEAIIVRDFEHRILYWNKGSEQLYGWAREETLGRRANELISPKDSALCEQAFQTVMGEGDWSGELPQRTKDGKNLIVESRWTLMYDEHKKPTSILVVNMDVTAKKQLEEQFYRAQRMQSLGTLAGGIAHDLNNVLAPVMLAIQIFKGKLTDEHSLRLLSTLETSVERGAGIVKQVLTFARGDDGERALLQPRHIMRDVEKIIRETFPKSIGIKANIQRDLWTILGDATHLHQVLMNLCVNARDAMPAGGTLSLKAGNIRLDEQYSRMQLEARAGAYVILSVEDTGTGIPPGILDKIFEPFFTTKTVGKGTGLGLATVASLVRSHGGFVRVKSEVGQGSIFEVYLPALLESHTEDLIADVTNFRRGNGESILVVDDEESIRNVTRETLEANGYRVMTAENGADALAVYVEQRESISLVLTDMAMPYLDGPSMIRALRKIDRNVKIVGSSGLADERRVEELGDVGMEAFLSKPYTAETLLKTLSETLG